MSKSMLHQGRVKSSKKKKLSLLSKYSVAKFKLSKSVQ